MCVFVCVYIYICVCVCVFMYVYIYIYIYMYVWVCEHSIEVCTCGNYPKSVSPFWHMLWKDFLWLQRPVPQAGTWVRELLRRTGREKKRQTPKNSPTFWDM